MVALSLQQSHQSGMALAGTWKLGAGRALTLQPREPGVLRIAHGSVWVTGDGPHAGPPGDGGDRFLGAGKRLSMARGERLVIEALAPGQPAYFSWDPVPPPERQPLGSDLAQPAHDLRLAIGLGARAGGRLLAALVVAVVRIGPAIIRRWADPNPRSTNSGATRSWTSQPNVSPCAAILPPA